MKKINIEKKKIEKKTTDILNEKLFENKEQIIIINQLFLEEFNENKILIMRELNKKINSYKQQDIEKSLSLDFLITDKELIEKLVCSKLKCYYCKKNVLLLYKYQREEYQWTLDRIDNNLGHSCENTLISCLKCNLERRRKISEAFRFTKQLKIKKTI